MQKMPNLSGLLTTGAVLLMAGAAPVAAGPEIQFTETQHDWGQINQGAVATYTFQFKNAGDAPLEVLDAKSSCECTVPTVQTKVVPPGQTGTLLVTFDSKRFSGAQTKDITVYSNDPAKGETELHLSAFVIPPLSVTPEVIDFGVIPRKGGKVQTVKVTSTDQKPFKILDTKTGLAFLTPKVGAGAGTSATVYSIDVTAGPDAPPGPFTDFLVVTTTHGTGDTLQAMIKGEIESFFQADPASIKFGTRPAKNEKLGDIHLIYRGPGKVKFLGATPSSPGIRAELKPDEATQSATLSVFLTDKAPGGRFTGSVTVKTDSADQPELAVKVLGYIRS